MTTRVNFSHNIGDVISDIDDVKRDIRKQMWRRVGTAVRVLWEDARQYVLEDPDATGDLFDSLSADREHTTDGLEFRVYTDAEIAPYAAIVEYGSGTRREISWHGGQTFPPLDDDSRLPPDYPFDAPNIDNISGFAYYIEEWMREKGIEPKYDSYRASALAIAKTIDDRGTYAHPYLRPAFFDNELKIRKAAKNALRNAVR